MQGADPITKLVCFKRFATLSSLSELMKPALATETDGLWAGNDLWASFCVSGHSSSDFYEFLATSSSEGVGPYGSFACSKVEAGGVTLVLLLMSGTEGIHGCGRSGALDMILCLPLHCEDCG